MPTGRESARSGRGQCHHSHLTRCLDRSFGLINNIQMATSKMRIELMLSTLSGRSGSVSGGRRPEAPHGVHRALSNVTARRSSGTIRFGGLSPSAVRPRP